MNRPMFLALGGALEDGENAVAAQLEANLAGRSLNAHEQRTLAAFGRILQGRRLARGLRLGLELRSDEDGHELLFTVASKLPEDVVLNFPPASLEHTGIAVDPSGVLTRGSTSRLVQPLDHGRVPAREEVAFSLGRGICSLGPATLARRDTWRLRLRSGEFLWEGGSYPAAGLAAPKCEIEKLREPLTVGAESPTGFATSVGELLGAAGPGAALSASQLLARAVQLDPRQREATLRALAEVMQPYRNDPFGSHPASAEVLDPALCWIARTGAPEASLRSWARWIAAWVQKVDLGLAENSGGLILPGR